MLTAHQLVRVTEVARRSAGLPIGTIAFAFVDDALMTDHHGRFLGKDSTTDVLAFPIDDEARSVAPAADDASAEYPYWGDVMICTDQAARQAGELGHPYLYELTVLALHGALHVLGYDHTSDGGRMSRLERSLRPLCIAAETTV